MTWMARVAATAALLLCAGRADAADADFESCRAAALEAQRLHAAQALLEERGELLKCLRPECPDVIQASCRGWLEENHEARPSLVVIAKDARGNDVVGATFTVDKDRTARKVDGKPLELNPGTHTIHGEAPSLAPLEMEIMVAIGVKLRPVTLSWPAAAETPEPTKPPPPPKTVEVRPIPARVLVLGAASAVALGAATVFGVLAWREYDDLRASNRGDQQPLPTYRVAGDVALGVGVVLAGLTLWQFLTRPAVRQFEHSSL